MLASLKWRLLPLWFAIAYTSLCLASGLEDLIDGRVVEDHSGAPIAAADVGVFKRGADDMTAQLETDHQGRFGIASLVGGEYHIEVTKRNYMPASVYVSIRKNLLTPWSIVVRLVRCGVITGQVTDPQGRPIRHARIMAAAQRVEAAPLYMDSRHGVEVDESGYYRLSGLGPGRYTVAVAYGAAAGGVHARALANVGSGVGFYPDAANPKHFLISGGEEYSGVNFVISPLALYSVAGSIELPDPGVRFGVALVPLDQPGVAVAITEADSQGAFRIEGIPAGAYRVYCTGPGVARGGRGMILGAEPWFGETDVTVMAGNISGLSVPVQKGRSIAVALQVQIAQNRENLCPSSAELTLIPVEDRGANIRLNANVSSARPVVIRNVPPGHYLPQLSGLGGMCQQASADILDLTGAPDSKPILIPVAPRGLIRGSVANSDTGLQTAVVLVPVDPVAGAPPVQIAFPDAGSRFSFSGLYPGRYRIAARSASAVAKTRWMRDPGGMQMLDVQSGSVTEIELSVSAEEN